MQITRYRKSNACAKNCCKEHSIQSIENTAVSGEQLSGVRLRHDAPEGVVGRGEVEHEEVQGGSAGPHHATADEIADALINVNPHKFTFQMGGYITAAIGFAILFSLAFGRHFCEVPKHYPRFDRVVGRAVYVGGTFVVLLAQVTPYAVSLRVAIGVLLASMGALIPIAMRLALDGQRQARE